LKLGLVQTEKYLIKQDAAGFVARGLQHEVGPVFAQQLRGMVNQITLHRPGTQVNGGITHDLSLGMGEVIR
jgi:hypothetical protein